MKIQGKIAIIVAVFGFFIILIVNIFLYTFLRDKDLSEIKQNARQTALLIRSALLNTMIRTGDYDEIANVIGEMQKGHDFEFRMVRSEHVIKQHGVKRDETPKDDLERRVLKTGEIIENMDADSIFRIIFPFITDERCAKCHLGMDDQPVPPGIVNGAAVIRFDLSEQHKETYRIIIKLLFLMTILTILLFIAFSIVVNRAVTRPIKKIASAIAGLQNEQYDIDLPRYNTFEFWIMAREVKKTAMALAKRKRERDTAEEAERGRASEIEQFIRSRAPTLGLAADTGISDIVGRLSHAVDEAQKSKLISIAAKYVEREHTRLLLPSDPDLIPAVSVYLLSVVEANPESAKRVSVELAIDEALSNAIYHGNLEVPSHLKVEDFDKFYEIAFKRKYEEPYASRKVEVKYELDRKGLKVVVRDKGAGFDWRKSREKDGAGADDRPHGRGLIIMRAFSSQMDFNEAGNEVTLIFDFNGDNSSA